MTSNVGSYPNPSSNDIVKAGFGSIKWLFILQLGSRILTFLLNTAIIRTVPQSTFAIANLQIQLLLNIILPLSREAFRRAVLRAPLDPSTNDYRTKAEKLLNFSYLSVPLGALLSVALTFLFLVTSTTEELETIGYREVITWVGLAAMIEMLSEPLYLLAQHRLMFGTRAAIELLAIAFKSVLSFFLVVYLQFGLASFGIATVIYCGVVSIGYWTYFGLISPLPEFPTFKSLLPHRIIVKNADGRPSMLSWTESFGLEVGGLLQYLATFEWQTLQKMLLQEGEKFVLRGAETLDNQGIFAIVNVLGSLVVRFVFAWLEEGLFPLFSKLLVQALSLPEGDSSRHSLLHKSSVILGLLSKLMCYIGLCFACFGPAYSFLLLDLLYTSKYSHTAAPLILAWYCVYIFIMGLNGITEAFAHSAGTARVLNYFNIAMVAQSVLFVVSSLYFLNAGFQAGVIMANCLVMSTRILLSVGYIRRFFKDNLSSGSFSVTQLVPNGAVIIMFIISYIITRLSESNFCSSATGITHFGCGQHIAVGMICLFFVGITAIWIERKYFKDLYLFIRRRDV
jgi:oligosaccharide translocation protein RFT1